MRFKTFLQEESPLPSQPTSKEITLERAAKWAKTMAPNVMSKVNSGKFMMYRGVPESKGQFQLGNTAWFKRVSKNTQNYYTKFISTSKNWKELPSRESAYVCTNKASVAEGYGNVFVVIPADDVQLAVITRHDMWKAFPILEKTLELPGLNSLNLLLVDLMRCIDGKVIPDTDIEGVRKAMRGWTMRILHDVAEGKFPNKKAKPPGYFYLSILSAVQEMAKHGLGNFEELLEYCLDPKVNNTIYTNRAMDAKVVPTGMNEIWFEGTAIFIRHDHFEEFLTEYNKK